MEQVVTRHRAYTGASGLGAAWAAFAVGLLRGLLVTAVLVRSR
jgi:hypothetical protein